MAGALAVFVVLAMPAVAHAATFGLNNFDVRFTGPEGEETTQAGSHPFAMTTSFGVNAEEVSGTPLPVEAVKDLNIAEVSGFIGDQTAVPRCSTGDFLTKRGPSLPECANDTVVGTIEVAVGEKGGGGFFNSPVYNLEPPPGRAAELGFWGQGVPVMIEVGLNEQYPYNLVVYTPVITQVLEFLSAEVTLWGVPADPAHDPYRGRCLTIVGGSSGECPAGVAPKPFLTLPRACEGPLSTSYELDSWEHPGEWVHGSVLTHDGSTPPSPFGMTGCGRLSFNPFIAAQPTTLAAQTPTGMDVGIDFEDEGLTSATGLAQSDLKKAVVTLPEGMTANPSMADGLAVCSEADLARETPFSGPGEGCPKESNIGTVEVETPLLEKPLGGSIYIAKPYANPFGTLLALYFVIREPVRGIVIRQPAEVLPDKRTGQLTTVVENIPQLPFSHFTVRFREGPRSPLVSPPACGDYETTAELTPTDGAPPLSTSSSFQISSGADAGPCPPGGVPPFSPQLTAGTLNNAAGSFSSLYIRIERKDGEQEITGFATKLPPGLTGSLTGIPFCGEAEIQRAREQSGVEAEASPACPAASQIGSSVAEAGVGSVLAQTPGSLYLGGPFEGAPFSVVDVTAAKVGPFDLGTVVVHLPLDIDPKTAQVSTPSGPADQIPHILDGIVIHLRTIHVYIDRKDFIRNPTSCEPMPLQSTIDGSGANFASAADDTVATITDRFQAADCAALPFAPKFTAATKARHTRGEGAYLRVSMESGLAQAGVKAVRVELPKALPSELKTLQHACTEAQFAENPAGCPAESVVGRAEVQTPILPVPLQGPAYFVSHGGREWPELIIVLQGYGVTIQLNGETFIDGKTGITSSTFKSVPDQPFSRFSLVLPMDSHSALAGNGDFCEENLTMPTYLYAQNGAQASQNTPIEVEGCPKTLAVRSHRVMKKTLILRVYAPFAGKLEVSGKGLKTQTKQPDARKLVTLKVPERKRGRLKTKVSVVFTPSKGSARERQVKTLFVKFKT
ncbi:MAG TPA: hypothetical protein VGF95_10080 [Solirubrobacteraceae bacterium]|jgi:hypothetical protein